MTTTMAAVSPADSWMKLIAILSAQKPANKTRQSISLDIIKAQVEAYRKIRNTLRYLLGSLAGFTPVSGLVENDRRTRDWDAQYLRAADISYRQLQLLAGPHFGVSWLDNFFLTEQPPGPPRPPDPERPNLQARYNIGSEVYGPGEHPFGTKYASGRTFPA